MPHPQIYLSKIGSWGPSPEPNPQNAPLLEDNPFLGKHNSGFFVKKPFDYNSGIVYSVTRHIDLPSKNPGPVPRDILQFTSLSRRI